MVKIIRDRKYISFRNFDYEYNNGVEVHRNRRTWTGIK